MSDAIIVSEIEDVLAECGVTGATLSQSERAGLDNQGYALLEEAIDAEWLARLRTAFEEGWTRNQQANQPTTPCKETGTRHINDLVNCSSAFNGLFTHPRVLAAIHHVLRCSFRLGQAGGRDPLPGFGQQGLHADWVARSRGEPFRIVTTIWLLDDFTEGNGPTRVVPGTHHLLAPPAKSFADPANRHPDQRLIIGRAGSVLVFNGHLWHSGTRNLSQSARRVLQCSFVGRDEYRFSNIKVNAPERLTPAARYVLRVS
jgi:ectoine hydroxylase-related dioxygenase (phytanoyl-CoA dioxygenase family)